MSQQELLILVVRNLDECGIEYMVTGSVASSLQGEPRSTHDLDLVVAMREENAPVIARLFPPPDFSVAEAAVREAILSRSMFNVLSLGEGDKIDFWMLTDEPYDQSRFSRRYSETVLGTDLKVSTPEDTILAKLSWAEKSGGSEKQFVDALRVYEVQHPELDEAYLDRWATELGVTLLLDRVRTEAEVGN